MSDVMGATAIGGRLGPRVQPIIPQHLRHPQPVIGKDATASRRLGGAMGGRPGRENPAGALPAWTPAFAGVTVLID